MWDSRDTTTINPPGHISQLSFYEYPPHKPYVNSTYQPLRPSHSLSRTVALPESNRDQLLTALQTLSLKIKSLENERERAETNLREITDNIHRPYARRTDLYGNDDDLHGKLFDRIDEHRPRKTRSSRKKKRTHQPNGSFDTATSGTTSGNPEGRHFHLDMQTVPFILGASTTPSHNVKSNVQNVIALLKNHNHQLCLSSKEYAEIQPHLRADLSPHTLLYLDHYNKPYSTSSSPIVRPSSASPVRAVRRPVHPCSSSTKRRPRSASRRPTSANMSEKQCYSRIKRLRQEFAVLAREHAKLSTSRTHHRELEIIGRRMEIILEELERLQRQLRNSVRKSSSRDQLEFDQNDTPLETLRKTRLLQLILRDSANQQEWRGGRAHQARPNSYD